MSNELQSLVAASQLNDYTSGRGVHACLRRNKLDDPSVVLTTAIVYDYSEHSNYSSVEYSC